MEITFKDKVVLITGGTKGIGLSIVKNLLNANAFVITSGRSEYIDDKIIDKRYRDRITYIQSDFSEKKSLKNFIKKLDKFGRIDVCINNVGTNINNPIEKVNIDDYYYLMDVNLNAPFILTQAISKKMAQNNYGRIVNIASIWSVITKPGRLSYTIAKHGIIGLTKTSAVDLSSKNILVNSVSPGFTLTELTQKTLGDMGINEISKIIPLKRLADPDEISKIVLFLASDQNTYITGQNIIIDGGFTIV